MEKRKRYDYHYFVNNEEVDLKHFLSVFDPVFTETRYFAGWCGVDSINYTKRDRALRQLRSQRIDSFVACGEHHGIFKITRTEKKGKQNVSQ